MISASPRGVKIFGGYELLDKIGEGGMGAVYKARRLGSTDQVALKLMSPEKGDTAIQLRRFEQEFQAARRLDHPNIVKVLDYGVEEGTHYLAMELVPGKSLAEAINSLGRLGESQAVEIILKVAAALGQVHELKLVHRDVKPDNILLAPGGVVKLTDLGLVKVLDNDIDLTQPNSGLGTPNYMAPEQFSDAKNADPRFDIYSLGATLYHAVTGKIPFKASTPMAVLKKKFAAELTPPRAVVPELSEQVERAILQAMCLDPARRFSSCSAFIASLTGKPATRTIRRSSGTIRVVRVPSQVFSGKEKRRHPRHACTRPGNCVPVSGHPADHWVATINDISSSGIGLTVNRRFEPGAILQIQLDSPPEEGPTQLLVRVVRCHQQGRSRKWVVGCTFAAPLDKEDLKGML